jgi:hypothetical protein
LRKRLDAEVVRVASTEQANTPQQHTVRKTDSTPSPVYCSISAEQYIGLVA